LVPDERAGWDFKRAVKDKSGQNTTAAERDRQRRSEIEILIIKEQ
jgi:hypothetical protein